ncbi:hypothetical protein AB7M22_001758 [Pseudomonas sp. ADAK2 TE3594]
MAIIQKLEGELQSFLCKSLSSTGLFYLLYTPMSLSGKT